MLSPIKRFACLITILLAVLTGCLPQKEVVYFQGNLPAIAQADSFKLQIHSGDLLSITVFTTQAEAYPYFSGGSDRPISDTRSVYEKGYVVRDSGAVTLPLIGSVVLDNMTLQEATEFIGKKYQAIISDALVTVKKLNFKVTVLGEVNRPGLYNMLSERATLPEVLGMAGDLTQFGDRKNVRIIRSEKGKSADLTFDLSNSSSLDFNVYYLHPDDVIYVSPNRKRAFQNANPAVLVFTSILTTTAILITAIVSANK